MIIPPIPIPEDDPKGKLIQFKKGKRVGDLERVRVGDVVEIKGKFWRVSRLRPAHKPAESWNKLQDLDWASVMRAADTALGPPQNTPDEKRG